MLPEFVLSAVGRISKLFVAVTAFVRLHLFVDCIDVIVKRFFVLETA